MVIKILRTLLYALSHLSIATSLTLMTFCVVDRINTAMAFIDHPMSRELMLAFSWAMIIICAVEIVYAADRHPIVCVICALSALSALSVVCLVLADSIDPAAILFTKPPVKTAVAVDAILGFVAALMHIVNIRKGASSRKRRKN